MTDDQPARLTDDRLAEIRAREQAATPGPWSASEPHPMCGEVWVVAAGDPDGAVATGLDDSPQDAAFIAHARSDIPALLAHIQALEAALAELRRACHLEMPEGERLSQSGYVCALCLWDADPDDPATHEPTCPLFVSGDAEGVQE